MTIKTPTKAKQPVSPLYRQQIEDAWLTLVLGFLSVGAMLWYYAHQELLLYGDAVAHINIARRVLDNRSLESPFFQLGTVWLPLQHIAMLPFVWNDTLWRSGVAGAIPTMVAYILGGLGVFRLVSGRGSRVAAFAATAIYALNPNLVYMQATAMNEPIYLAFFIWGIAYFDQWLRGLFPSSEAATSAEASVGPASVPVNARRSLELCGVMLAGAAFTRYDGWFFGAIMGALVIAVFAAWYRQTPGKQVRRAMTRSLVEFLLLNALIPVFWLAYNYRVSGKAMDWANGPYSAKAIAKRTTAPGSPPYPGEGRIVRAAQYFVKAGELNIAPNLLGNVMFALALGGTAIAAWRFRRYKALLLLWVPLLFYALSIAYGSVPIFLPLWWPFSYYNVRYGLELLPVFAVFPALLADYATEAKASLPSDSERSRPEARLYRNIARHQPTVSAMAWGLLGVVVGLAYVSAWRAAPICLQEARVNARTRVAMEDALADFLRRVPPSATLMMYQGTHVGALQRAGIPLRRVVSEIEHPEWDWALVDPAKHASFIVACTGDPVWTAVRQHRAELEQLLTITVPEQGRCSIYRPKQSEGTPAGAAGQSGPPQ